MTSPTISENAAIDAVIDLMMRDAEPMIAEWVKRYRKEHNGKEPSKSEIDKAVASILETLKSDSSRYHFTNLRPAWNSDGKTWRLEHVSSRQ